MLRERFQAHGSGHWQARLLEAGIPCGPINAIDQVFADPQVLARDMLIELAHPTAEAVKLAGSPLKLSRTPVRYRAPPPLLGQHTKQVLQERLGYSPERIAALEEQGVI
jgi:crotonobetainyl-CoA:carnitine CoA-transferase CaiB-like acyl-CoA transferase